MKIASIFRQSVLYFLGNLARRVVGFVMIPVYTRYLTPADYGLIELVELFVSLGTITFGVLALFDAMVRIYYEYTDERDRGAVVATAVSSMAAITLCLTLLAVIAAVPLSRAVFGTEQHAPLIRAAFVALLFNNLGDLALVYMRIKERAVFFVVFSTAQLALALFLNIYLIVFNGAGVWGFMASKIITSFLAATILLTLVFREVGYAFKWDAARRMISFGFPLILTSASFFVIHFADRFFLSHFGTLAQVGVYALAYKCGFLVTYLVGEPFGNVWTATLYAYTNDPAWKEQFSRVARYLLGLLVFAGLGISIFADELLAILVPESFRMAALVIPVIAFGYVFREIGDFFREMLYINKKVRLFSMITVSCAVLNLILNYTLIRHGQLIGAATATIITWLVYMAACWIAAQQEHRLPLSTAAIAKLFGVGFVVYWASLVLKPAPILGQFATDALLMVAGLAAIYVLKYFSNSERDAMWQLARQQRNRFVKAATATLS